MLLRQERALFSSRKRVAALCSRTFLAAAYCSMQPTTALVPTTKPHRGSEHGWRSGSGRDSTILGDR